MCCRLQPGTAPGCGGHINEREEKKEVKPVLVFLVKYSCLMMWKLGRED